MPALLNVVPRDQQAADKSIEFPRFELGQRRGHIIYRRHFQAVHFGLEILFQAIANHRGHTHALQILGPTHVWGLLVRKNGRWQRLIGRREFYLHPPGAGLIQRTEHVDFAIAQLGLGLPPRGDGNVAECHPQSFAKPLEIVAGHPLELSVLVRKFQWRPAWIAPDQNHRVLLQPLPLLRRKLHPGQFGHGVPILATPALIEPLDRFCRQRGQCRIQQLCQVRQVRPHSNGRNRVDLPGRALDLQIRQHVARQDPGGHRSAAHERLCLARGYRGQRLAHVVKLGQPDFFAMLPQVRGRRPPGRHRHRSVLQALQRHMLLRPLAPHDHAGDIGIGLSVQQSVITRRRRHFHQYVQPSRTQRRLQLHTCPRHHFDPPFQPLIQQIDQVHTESPRFRSLVHERHRRGIVGQTNANSGMRIQPRPRRG